MNAVVSHGGRSERGNASEGKSNPDIWNPFPTGVNRLLRQERILAMHFDHACLKKINLLIE